MVKAREIAETLKSWIRDRKFLLGRPAQLLPDMDPPPGSGPETEK
jgi:hypothetical protein